MTWRTAQYRRRLYAGFGGPALAAGLLGWRLQQQPGVRAELGEVRALEVLPGGRLLSG